MPEEHAAAVRDSGIVCPYCGSFHSEVKDSRPIRDSIRRRRRCHGCRAKFTTYEFITPRLYVGDMPVEKLRTAVNTFRKISAVTIKEMDSAMEFIEKFGSLTGGAAWRRGNEKADTER